MTDRTEPPNDAKRAAFVMAVNAARSEPPTLVHEGYAEPGTYAVNARSEPRGEGLRCPVCAEIQADEAMVVGHIVTRHGWEARRHLRLAATPPAPALDDEDINARRFTRWFLMQDRGKQADWIRSVYPKLDDLLGILAPERQDE